MCLLYQIKTSIFSISSGSNSSTRHYIEFHIHQTRHGNNWSLHSYFNYKHTVLYNSVYNIYENIRFENGYIKMYLKYTLKFIIYTIISLIFSMVNLSFVFYSLFIMLLTAALYYKDLRYSIKNILKSS